ACGSWRGWWPACSGWTFPTSGIRNPLARATRAAGREPGDRPPGGERGRDPRLLAADRQHRPAELRVRAALRPAALRPEAGEAAPRRGRLSGRFRRGRLPPLPALLLDGRGAGRLSPGRRDPDADQDDGARGLPDRVAGEDAARGPARDHGRVGQRGHAAGGVRDEDRHLRLRGPPGGRGPLPPPGPGARPEKAGGAAASDPEGRPRPRVARTDLPAGVSLRYRPAR